MIMRVHLICTLATLTLSSPIAAQEIVEVPASKANVSLPEDIFSLPPGQWFVAKRVSQGNEPCTPDACEAGFNSGNLVISVEHAKNHVMVIAGFRDCQGVAFQEIETGMKPGSGTRGEVSSLLKKVVKAAEKSCKVKAPAVPKLDVASLFPKGAT
jgi:hypothetical protein